ncbi:MAG: phenylalanine--tRNA ligase subunit beta [Thaumarchaeota archaeon]|nr:phenylalanine--tRNA ligase subunit beta [Nitrososphaerota archaeon]
MPVVTLYFNHLKTLLEKNLTEEQIKEALPYLGLDLEEAGEGFVRVEYNPNRPDYSTDVGIARGLNGLLGFNSGTPKYSIIMGGTRVIVDQSVIPLRPQIVCLKVRGLHFDDESIRQLISMQEDLHAGIGRKRRRVSIGIHNFDVVDPPFHYVAAPPSFRFPPLGYTEPMTMAEILEKTEQGKTYGHIVKEFSNYPLITDANGKVLSFPPIINGERTRVSAATKNLFIDVTGTDLRAVGDALTIVASFLHDTGGKLETVSVDYPHASLATPNMSPFEMPVNVETVNRLLGLDLSSDEIIQCLGKCRITAMKRGNSIVASVPRYRTDMLHQVDIVEEVAIGYGIQNFTATTPSSYSAGGYDKGLKIMSRVEDVLVGLGLVEAVNLTLISEEAIAKTSGGKGKASLKVDDPKSMEHEVLRDNLLPSLLMVLARNVHEEYPQRVFEVTKVFQQDPQHPYVITEEPQVAAVMAHSEANFTEAKSLLSALLKQAFNTKCSTSSKPHPSLCPGRSASVKISNTTLGFVGEIRPEVLREFQLRTPVAAFQVNIGKLIEDELGRK